MVNSYFHITRDKIKNSKPGYCQNAGIACMHWFEKIATTYVDHEWVDGEHIFKPGLGYISCYALPKSISVEATTEGESGVLNKLWIPKLFIPGDSPELQHFLDQLKNEDFLLFVQETDYKADYLLQFGNCRVPARINSIKYTSGNIYDGRKGYELEFIATERYFYNPNAMHAGNYVLPPYLDPEYVN